MTLKLMPFEIKNYVVESTYEQGSTKFGYGDLLEEAIKDSHAPEELFGKITDQKIWVRTEKTGRYKKGIHNYYRLED